MRFRARNSHGSSCTTPSVGSTIKRVRSANGAVHGHCAEECAHCELRVASSPICGGMDVSLRSLRASVRSLLGWLGSPEADGLRVVNDARNHHVLQPCSPYATLGSRVGLLGIRA